MWSALDDKKKIQKLNNNHSWLRNKPAFTVTEFLESCLSLYLTSLVNVYVQVHSLSSLAGQLGALVERLSLLVELRPVPQIFICHLR